jgi:hypothetical protein
MPQSELRGLLIELRDQLSEVVADGGEDAEWFLDAARNHLGEQARDWAGRVGDDTLKRHLAEGAKRWAEATAQAPPHQRARLLAIINPRRYQREDADRQRMFIEVVNTAKLGVIECDSALDRLTELEGYALE